MNDGSPFSSPLLDQVGGFVDGAWILAEVRPCFVVTDPANGEVLAYVPELGAAEARAAVEAARAALSRVGSLAERRGWLTRIAELLTEHADELAMIITRENGKPLGEARGEVLYAAGFYAHAATSAEHLVPRVLDERPRGLTWTVHHRPAGVVGLITPWNFPLAMLAKKLSAALAAGCAAVVKPAEVTPLTCVAFFRLLERVGLPRGLVNLVAGDAQAIGEVLCSHPAVRVLSFTGSTAVGRKLAAQAAPHLKRLSLELGGNAPCLVFEDADLDATVEALVANKLRAAGQTCVCTNRVLAHASIADALATKLASRVAALVVGPGTEPNVDVGPLIDGRGWDKVHDHVEDAVERGASVVGGALADRPTETDGWFFRPMVLSGVPLDARCMQAETFGPLLPIATFTTEDEAMAIANDVDAGLAAYVFTADGARAERVARGLRFGHVGLGTATGPTPEAPFGGMGASGYGREGGLEGLMEYVEIQTVPSS
ncbi:MAG: NAD-dependent succinate-semialdehyde dehydrogenase [Sandaracinaceae bacterium]|nr:NAD-dependent succinate-semialdehyde dehydrogenase [Sandaracinaceae bacterium]